MVDRHPRPSAGIYSQFRLLKGWEVLLTLCKRVDPRSSLRYAGDDSREGGRSGFDEDLEAVFQRTDGKQGAAPDLIFLLDPGPRSDGSRIKSGTALGADAAVLSSFAG